MTVFTFNPVLHLNQKRKQRRRRKHDAKEKKDIFQAVKTKSNRNKKSSRPTTALDSSSTFKMEVHSNLYAFTPGLGHYLKIISPDRAAILSKYRRTITGFILDV